MSNRELELGSINRYYLTRDSYTIDPRYLDEPGVELGQGIDLRDPGKPKVAPYTAFRSTVTEAAQIYELPTSSNVISESAVLKDALSEREEANVLSAFFKASYMLSSAQGAFEAASKERKSYHMTYALLEYSGQAERLPEECRHWQVREVPFWESFADPDEVLYQFVQGYGSHYVSTITYGLRIAIQGKMSQESREKSTAFSAAFKAAFESFSAEAGVRNEQRKKFEEMAVDLVLEATSGGHSGGLSVLRGFDDIAQFLDSVKSDKIQFAVAPIELTLKSYWPTLPPDWEKTRAALDPRSASFKTPGAPYGVPKGTIIAWHPMADYVERLPSEGSTVLPVVRIAPPSGWAICDGTLDTPDLRGLFIRGAAEWTGTVTTGGTKEHLHGGKTGLNSEKRGAHGGAGAGYRQPAEVHTHVINPDTHLPPYAELVYIMKLDDLP